MTAAHAIDLSIGAQPASETLRNLLMALAGSNDHVVRDLVSRALEQVEQLEHDHRIGVEFVGELEIQGLHVHIPFEGDGPYKLQRRYVRTIAECQTWHEVVAIKTELAKLGQTLTKRKES